MTIKKAILELESIKRVYAHIRRNDGEWEAVEMAIAALRAQQEAEKNGPLACNGCKEFGKWENEVECGYPSPCTTCKRRATDNYRRPPAKEA